MSTKRRACFLSLLFKVGYSLLRLKLFLLLLIVSTSLSHANFDISSNWGFIQGGGFRQGNFTGEDKKIKVVAMALDQSSNQLAVAGAIGEKWAVRIYRMGVDGPDLIASWTNDQNLEFSVITSLEWISGSGKLVCAVEHLVGNQSNIRLLTLDPTNKSSIESVGLSGWVSVVDMQPENTNNDKFLLLGIKNKKAVCVTVDLSTKVISDEFLLKGIDQPRALSFVNGQIIIAGQDGRGARIESYSAGKRKAFKKIGNKFLITQMVEFGGRIFLTGCSSQKEFSEDFFLSCFESSGNLISESWSVLTKSSLGGVEIGTSLLPMSDGGVMVGGNFSKSWKLGQSTPTGKLAQFTGEGDAVKNFDSFLARYDENGNLLWAQESGFSGNDFLMDQVLDGQDNLIILGNRKIDGGFGPYLSKINASGNLNKNVALVEPGNSEKEQFSVISWDPPETLRFGEPVSNEYFSARALGKAKFSYSINGKRVFEGNTPLFDPGKINLSAQLIRDSVTEKSTTKSILGLKGRLYLKLSFAQDRDNVRFNKELYGLHPDHSFDRAKRNELLDKVRFELVTKNGNQKVENGIVQIQAGITGTFSIIAIFDGDSHYESTSRRLTIMEKNGVVSVPSGQSNTRIQVKDLDGWQNDSFVERGTQLFISATQGFGTNRKFNRWVEFSNDARQLQTASVQSPFSLRTALLADRDMTLFAHYNFTFSGSVVNGYLSGSKVFLDFNLNGILDEDEPFGYSTTSGGFDVEVSEEDLLANDRNGDGMIDHSEAMLVVLGGTDRSSSLPLSIQFRAPPSYSVITAVSTVVSKLVESGKSLDEAEQIVSQYFSLSSEIKLSTFEPLKSAFLQKEAAKDFVNRSTQLANLMNLGARFIEVSTEMQTDRVKGSEFIVSAIGNKVLEQIKTSANSKTQTFDLTNLASLTSIVAQADFQAKNEQNLSSTGRRSGSVQSLGAESQVTPLMRLLAEQISSANQALNDIAKNSSMEATGFKALASASQNILDKIGEEVVIANTEDPNGGGNPSGSSSNEFTLNALQDFATQAQINVYAPILNENKLSAPSVLNDNLIVGGFSAIDPEGTASSFALMGQNPDFDMDGVSILSIDSETGQLKIQDLDDLKLMNMDLLNPILRVSDPFGLYIDQRVEINLREWTYLLGRNDSSGINTQEDDNSTILSYSIPLDSVPGWWENWWFGSYYVVGDKGWIYHQKLGWLYMNSSVGQGTWLWKDSLGWLWTKSTIYPFLYSSSTSGWLYFSNELGERSLFFDYLLNQWEILE